MAYLKVKIEPDTDLSNPTEDDCQWQVASFQRGHVNTGSRMDFYGIGWQAKLRAGTAFLLHYQEHGDCRWSIWSGDYAELLTTAVGGIAWFEKPREMGAKTYDARKADCATFLECYTDWCNGAGVGYEVTLIDGDLDSDGEPIGDGVPVCFEEPDSCWGFYVSAAPYFIDEVARSIRAFQEKYEADFKRALPRVYAGALGVDYKHAIESRLDNWGKPAAPCDDCGNTRIAGEGDGKRCESCVTGQCNDLDAGADSY